MYLGSPEARLMINIIRDVAKRVTIAKANRRARNLCIIQPRLVLPLHLPERCRPHPFGRLRACPELAEGTGLTFPLSRGTACRAPTPAPSGRGWYEGSPG